MTGFCGGLRGGAVTLESSVSSQFASSVLMVAPYCDMPLTLTLMMRMRGVRLKRVLGAGAGRACRRRAAPRS